VSDFLRPLYALGETFSDDVVAAAMIDVTGFKVRELAQGNFHKLLTTADALHVRRDNMAGVLDRDGHYVLTVKNNQCAASMYTQRNWEGFEEISLGLIAYPAVERSRGTIAY
jgi:hypothetical protein